MSEWIPISADLEKFPDLAKDNGLLIKNIPISTVLQLEAVDGSILRLTVTDPLAGMAKLNIINSANINGDYEGIVAGSTFGGSMIKVGWIGAGMCLEFHNLVGRSAIIHIWIKTISVVVFTPLGSQTN